MNAGCALFRGISGFAGQVDDLLDSDLQERFDVLTDKGTLDAVGLSADAEINRYIIAPLYSTKLMCS